MAPRKTAPTVEVDAAQLGVALALIATNVAPSTTSPAACRAMLALEHDLARGHSTGSAGFLDIGWGLRAGDQS